METGKRKKSELKNQVSKYRQNKSKGSVMVIRKMKSFYRKHENRIDWIMYYLIRVPTNILLIPVLALGSFLELWYIATNAKEWGVEHTLYREQLVWETWRIF